jgi:SAM-dependent methyltransferase
LFWARARDKYRGLSPDDEDIRKFQKLSNNFQNDIYQGIAGAIQDLGHRWVAARTPAGSVLEIGFGGGRHSLFYRGEWENYIASEFTAVHLKSPLWEKFRGRILRCDARRLPFAAKQFDAVISIYNLEHIADLQSVFREVHRVLTGRGRFLVALPCEGGLLWNIGRELTSRRLFQRKYGLNYDKVIAFEHVWDFHGVRAELLRSGLFRVLSRRFIPAFVPSVHLNLIGCMECAKA